MVKQARAVVTREQILRGAAEVFDRYGYGATTVSDVIAQAGVTKGALYFHFGSKEDLARAVIEQQHALSILPARRRIDEHAPGLESVIRLSQHLAGRLVDDVIVRAGIRLTLEHGTFGGSVSSPYRDWVAVTERLLRRAIDEGDLRDSVKPAALARFRSRCVHRRAIAFRGSVCSAGPVAAGGGDVGHSAAVLGVGP